MARSARGPKREPLRFVTPRSMGTPTSAMSRPAEIVLAAASGIAGASRAWECRRTAICAYRRGELGFSDLSKMGVENVAAGGIAIIFREARQGGLGLSWRGLLIV